MSGNNGGGVLIRGISTGLNVVAGNYIGTDVTGSDALGNGSTACRSRQRHGQPDWRLDHGHGKRHRLQRAAGVSVPASSTNNAILGNSIYSNGGLGIDLNSDGVTPNDASDADTGGNNLQNFPVLTPAAGGVTGTLNSTPNATFRIEFFSSATCDPSATAKGRSSSAWPPSRPTAPATPPFRSSRVARAVRHGDGHGRREQHVRVLRLRAGRAGGTARTWISNTSGNWEDPANWSGGIVPQNGDDVVIIRRRRHRRERAVGDRHAEQPAKRRAVSIRGGPLTFNGAGAIQRRPDDEPAASLDGPGAILLGGNSLWTGGNINRHRQR